MGDREGSNVKKRGAPAKGPGLPNSVEGVKNGGGGGREKGKIPLETGKKRKINGRQWEQGGMKKPGQIYGEVFGPYRRKTARRIKSENNAIKRRQGGKKVKTSGNKGIKCSA